MAKKPLPHYSTEPETNFTFEVDSIFENHEKRYKITFKFADDQKPLSLFFGQEGYQKFLKKITDAL